MQPSCPHCDSTDTMSIDGMYDFECNDCGLVFTAKEVNGDEDCGQDR